jgi:drug/metabolite transporter (DMT)-like permease
MNWAAQTIIAGVVNASVNFGYKVNAAADNIYLLSAWVIGICSLCLFGAHAATTRSIQLRNFLPFGSFRIAAGMAVGMGAIFLLFLNAMTTGPLSIIDPLLACVYTVTSLVLGLTVLKESPGFAALSGVALYIASSLLMSLAR